MIMNSAINPLVTPSQDSITGNQVNKTIHTQGTTTSYCQPSHMPQSLGNMHANTNVAHSHPNQQHHYSLNVPNTTGHYINQNMGQIPASNHPVANPSSTAAGQGCNPQKNVTNYMSNYQANLALQQNQNAFLPVSQALPASVPSQLTATTASENSERQQSEGRQSNGTPEVKSPEKKENVSSFSSAPKENNVQPAPVPQLPQIQEHAEETPTPVLTAVPTQASQLNSAEAIGAKMPTSVLLVANSKPSSSSCSDTQQTETTATTTMTANFISSTHMENNDNSAVSTSVENIIRESEFKKIDVEENSTSTEQPENLEKNKPFESDTDAELEKDKPARAVEPTVTNEEEKVSPKLQERTCPKEESSSTKQTPATAVAPGGNRLTKTPTRKVKPQTLKSDESRILKEPKTSVLKSPSTTKAKRQRIKTQPYQSPLPEVELISKISSLTPRTPRSNDEKLIVFYKNEFLAVRNAEGSFYLCQAVQNVYKSSSKIKIRWLSQDKNDKTGEIYTPDFYDLTDFDCILTNLSLNRLDKAKFRLPLSEKDRTQSILNRSLAVEKGDVTSSSLTEEHPDGLDLSLYRDEDQLKKRRAKKRKAGRKPSSLSTKKEVPTKKSPEASKVRRVPSAKNILAKETLQHLKKKLSRPESKESVRSSSRASGRGKRKKDSKTSPVVDQKKAKVLVKIGRKTVIPAAKSVQSNTKNAKSATKTAASAKKASQTKTGARASVKPPPRNARRSTRK